MTPVEGWVPWPAEEARRYRAAGWWRGRPLDDLVRDRVAAHPDRPAVTDGRLALTYGELDTAAGRLAAGLAARGLAPGDRVVVHLPNRTGFVVVLLALLRLGAWPVLTLADHRESEIGHVLRLGGAAAYVVADDLPGHDLSSVLPRLRTSCPELREVLVLGEPPAGVDAVRLADVDADPVPHAVPDPGDPALLLLSGGSTGLPKLIPRTHDDYAYNVRRMAELCALGASDVYLAVLPAAHNFPLACPGLLGALATGGRVVLAPNASPPEVFPLIAAHGVTVTSLVPAQAALWMRARAWLEPDLSTLRLVQVGGARLPDATAGDLPSALGVTLQQVFGMAEGLLNATRLDDPLAVVSTTQGRPICPDDDVRVVDGDGVEVAPGGVGELLVRGPYTLRGYFRAPDHNARSFTPDGYYRSGDLVRRTPGGDVVVVGRTNDLINRAGEKVAPDEVEGHLVDHPGVEQVVVVGVDDPVVGQRVCACLTAVPGAEPDVSELRAFLTGRGIAAYKQPERVETITSWPLTRVGKIDRKALAARLHPGGAVPPDAGPAGVAQPEPDLAERR